MLITAKHATETGNAEFSHFWEWASDLTTDCDNETTYHREKPKEEDILPNLLTETRICPGTVAYVLQLSEKQTSNTVAESTKMTDGTDESQMDTGKTAIHQNAFINTVRAKLAQID